MSTHPTTFRQAHHGHSPTEFHLPALPQPEEAVPIWNPPHAPSIGIRCQLVTQRALPPALQPEEAAPIWNLRGVNCNSWHRVTVNVE